MCLNASDRKALCGAFLGWTAPAWSILILVLLATAFLSSTAWAQVREASDPARTAAVLAEFLNLADTAAAAMLEEPIPGGRRKGLRLRDYNQNFVDSYAVRALAVAYDLTGRERYLAACRAWSDRMLRFQAGMIPAGFYYMDYSRKPGESKGELYVADGSSIVMGVLATALRCPDADRQRYLESCRSFATVVLDNFVRESGGVTDGFWQDSDKEWWCSTALFAAFLFQFHGVTGEPRYVQTALRALDWLAGFSYDREIIYRFEDGAPTTIFYVLEAYASGLPWLAGGSDRQRSVTGRFSETVEWIVRNQDRRGWWDYNPDNWGVKLNGFPCHLTIYLNHVEDKPRNSLRYISPSGATVSFRELTAAATDRAFDYLTAHGPRRTPFTQPAAFAMMSCAEKLCPDELYWKKTGAFPYHRYTEEEISGLLKRSR
jgi:hypothetical protein